MYVKSEIYSTENLYEKIYILIIYIVVKKEQICCHRIELLCIKLCDSRGQNEGILDK